MAFFMGGVRKTEVLKALNPHIFFDDQDRHLEDIKDRVPTGKVLYRSDSELRKLLDAKRSKESDGS